MIGPLYQVVRNYSEATMKINDIDINTYKTHDVINSLEEL
jgi:hypothetical protein